MLTVGQTLDLSQLAAWARQAAPADVYGPRVEQDEQGVIALSTFLGDVDVTPKSRAQLISPFAIEQGLAYRLDGSFRVATGALPQQLPAGAWVELVQVAYGPPYAGSPPLRWMVQGDMIEFRHADDPPLWSETLQREVWYRFSVTWLHALSGGWMSLTLAHDQATPVQVLAKQSSVTVLPSNDSPLNACYLDCYQSGLQQAGPIEFEGFALTRVS